MKKVVSISRLHEVFMLSTDGKLLNRIGRGSRAKAGDEAGTEHSAGYRQVKVDGCLMFAHRVAFAMSTGAWPLHEVDHIDGDRSNNRPANLRDVSRSENNQNQRCGIRGATRLLGAHPHQGRFRSSICIEGRSHYLGMFGTATEAHAAYVRAKRSLHPGGQL